MGVDLLSEDTDYLISRMGMRNPATSIGPAGSNFLGAGVQGAVGGLADAADLAMDVGDAAQAYAGATAGGMSLSPFSMFTRGYGLFTDTYEEVSGQKLRDQIKAVQEWSKMDPRTTGPTSMMFGQVVRGATLFGVGTLAGGPWGGASLLASTEGYTTYNDMREQGVDPYTSMGLGALVGVTSGVGALLPASIGAKSLVGMMASGAAINATAGVVQRGWMSTILDANGYKDMAEQYRMLDGQALAADVILGAAFGGIARFVDGKGEKALPTREEIEAALDIERQHLRERGTLGLPLNEQARELDSAISDETVDALLSGRTFNVDPAEAQFVAKNTLADPVVAQLQDARAKVAREALGDLAEEPVITPEVIPETPAPKPDTEPPRPPEQQDVFKDMNPMAVEQINRLSEDPEMEIDMYDGTVVKAADLRQKIIDDLTQKQKDLDLFDTAAACMLGTES